jgi:hypothetical protein
MIRLNEDAERRRLPMLFAALIALYGASRFDVTRPLAGALLTYGFPVAAVLMGFLPINESSMRGPGIVVAAVAAGAAELAIGRELQPSIEIFGLVPAPVVSVALVLSLLGAVIVQALAHKRGVRNLFAAWVGIVTMLGLYLPSHAKVGRDSLDSFIAALLVSLFVGGGAGLFLGLIVTSIVKGRTGTEQPDQKHEDANQKKNR